MKKKIITAILLFLLIIISVSIILILYKEEQKNQENKNQERYNEIRKNVKKAVEWNISAMYPKCAISKEFKQTSYGTYYNSSFLIKNGYIKKEELLDVDQKSYCEIYVEVNTYYANPLDHQNNCEVYYKIYLKCKDYKDKGYKKGGLEY